MNDICHLRLKLLSKPVTLGSYFPLTQVMIGVLCATYPGLQSKRHWSADKRHHEGYLFGGGLCQLTRVGVGLSVQESGVRNWDFLHLAAPLAVGNAARFGTGVA